MRGSAVHILALVSLLIIPAVARAFISISGATPSYSADFNADGGPDALPVTGSPTFAAVDWHAESDRTLATSTPLTTIITGTGSASGGGLYSFGAASSSERALGLLAAAGPSPVPSIGVEFRNTDSRPIGSLSITYTGEQWRRGSKPTVETLLRAETLVFQYSVGATGILDVSGTWTSVPALNFTTPDYLNSSASALDGNTTNTLLSASVGGLNIVTNTAFWFRWNDLNDDGSDHALAIDNFTLTATFVPEPAGMGILMLATLAAATRRRSHPRC